MRRIHNIDGIESISGLKRHLKEDRSQSKSKGRRASQRVAHEKHQNVPKWSSWHDRAKNFEFILSD